ncbi:MAG TPA: hypothetical protein VKI44_13500 [Acetobacteraceae bacterium]|nr:hypothetical protein [Acetobacteraceae bacterium]
MAGFRRTLACLALSAAVVVSGCVAPSQPYLDNAKSLCASGDQVSCGQVPGFQAQVNAEHNEQAAKVAGGFLAVLGAVAVGAAAGYAASHPVYAPPPPPVVYVCRWNCW